MRSSVMLITAALLVAACGHTRETTIVERPVTQREVIIEKPMVLERETIRVPSVSYQYRCHDIVADTYSNYPC